MSFSKVYQSYQDNLRVVLKGWVKVDLAERHSASGNQSLDHKMSKPALNPVGFQFIMVFWP